MGGQRDEGKRAGRGKEREGGRKEL